MDNNEFLTWMRFDRSTRTFTDLGGKTPEDDDIPAIDFYDKTVRPSNNNAAINFRVDRRSPEEDISGFLAEWLNEGTLKGIDNALLYDAMSAAEETIR